MKVKVYPGRAEGKVVMPPSKSVGHRALIAAALSEGKSVISNLGHSKDIEATVGCLCALGANIKLNGDTAEVEGRGIHPELGDVFCNESGSTLRFLIPVFALSDKEIVFKGAGKLMQRPQSVYKTLFDEKGLKFEQTADSIRIRGPLSSGVHQLDGSVSSQFFTGLLFALPLCDGDSILKISEPFESRSYVEMTLDVLSKFGIRASWSDRNTLEIPGNQKYTPQDLRVEGDYSSSAFFGLLGAVNAPIEVCGLNKNSRQGDRVFFDFLKRIGANVTETENGYSVSKNLFSSVEFDLADCPDLGPASMVLGCLSGKKMKLSNIARLRYKESDRVACMIEELNKFGYQIDATENEAIILPEKQEVKEEVIVVDSHNDHRIAMSIAILATVSDRPVIIETAESVAKSYPDFYKDLSGTGIKVEAIE